MIIKRRGGRPSRDRRENTRREREGRERVEKNSLGIERERESLPSG